MATPTGAFGKGEWERYFHCTVADPEPPLPSNVHEFLNSPCPFWPNKRVRDTHFLLMIPCKVNNKPFTIALLAELCKAFSNRQSSSVAAINVGLDPSTRAQLGGFAPFEAKWVLVTKEAIPSSYNKTKSEQIALIGHYAGYTLSSLLVATAAAAAHKASNGSVLFVRGPNSSGNNPSKLRSYIRCQESVHWPGGDYEDGKTYPSGEYPTMVGILGSPLLSYLHSSPTIILVNTTGQLAPVCKNPLHGAAACRELQLKE